MKKKKIINILSHSVVSGICASIDERFWIWENDDSGQGVWEQSGKPPAVVPQTESHVGIQLCESNQQNHTQTSHNTCQSSNATINKKVCNMKLNIQVGSEIKWKCRTEFDFIQTELFGS